MTPKQLAFVREYLIDLNATQAAIRAGYSAHMAQHIGYQALQKTPVQQAIQAAQAERAKRLELSADSVLQDIDTIKLDAMKPGPLGAMVNHAAALKAAELQGRHLGMWNDKLALTGRNGGPLQFVQRVERVVVQHDSLKAIGAPKNADDPD